MVIPITNLRSREGLIADSGKSVTHKPTFHPAGVESTRTRMNDAIAACVRHITLLAPEIVLISE